MHIGNLITKQVLHFLYNACGKWYFQSKISPFGLIQAGHTKLENGVSLSMGIVEKIWNMFCDQGANVHLWLNSRMFWFFRLTLVFAFYLVLWKKCWIVKKYYFNFILSSHFSVIWFLWSFLKYCTTLQEEKISFVIIMNIHFSVSKFNWKSITQLLMCKSTTQRTNVMFEPRICFPQKLHLFYWIDSEHHCGKKVGKKCCWNHQTQLTQFFCFSGVSMRTRSMRWK